MSKDTNGLSTAERLNEFCACTTLDRAALDRALSREFGDAEEILTSPLWQQVFAGSAVFVPQADLEHMVAVVCALEAAATLPG